MHDYPRLELRPTRKPPRIAGGFAAARSRRDQKSCRVIALVAVTPFAV